MPKTKSLKATLKTYNYFIASLALLPDDLYYDTVGRETDFHKLFNDFWKNTPREDQIEYQKEAEAASICSL